MPSVSSVAPSAHIGQRWVCVTCPSTTRSRCTKAGSSPHCSQATAAPRLKKSDGLIDFSADAAAVRNLIHGTWPWPGARAKYVPAEGKPIEVQIARAAAVEGAGPAGGPGEILEDLTVATGGGRLQIIQIKPAGRRLMAWRDFANGYRAGPGAKFTAAGG